MVDWLQQNWGIIYLGGGVILGGLTALAVFVGIWWGAAHKYAFGGLVAGWIPGAVGACVASVVMAFGWPLILPVMLYFGPSFLRAMDDALA